MPQLKVMSLNVGRILQARTRSYLERLATGKEERPEVMYIQDLPFRDLHLFEWAPHVAFAPMTNHLINGERAVVGIAVVSRYFMTDIAYCTTWGDGVLKDLQGVGNNNQRIAPTAENDRLIEATEDRVAICATVVVEDNGMANGKFNTATTHGFWVRGGVVNDQQRESTRKLFEFTSLEGIRRDGLLLVGDMNFGRGGEIYNQLVGPSVGSFTDSMPLKIDNTLDPDHPAVRKGLKVVTDCFFDFNRHDRSYHVSDVRLHSGVSDHCAVSAVITQGYGL